MFRNKTIVRLVMSTIKWSNYQIVYPTRLFLAIYFMFSHQPIRYKEEARKQALPMIATAFYRSRYMLDPMIMT